MNATYCPRWKTPTGTNISIPEECIETHFPSEPDIVNRLGFKVDMILTAPSAFSFIVYLITLLLSGATNIFYSSIFSFAIYIISFRHIITADTTLVSVLISAYRLLKLFKINWIILIVLCAVYKTPLVLLGYITAILLGFILRLILLDRVYASIVSNKIGCNIGLADVIIIKLMKKHSKHKLNFYSYAHYIARYIIEANFNESGEDYIGNIHPVTNTLKNG